MEDEEDELTDDEIAEEVSKSKRYSLVQQGKYYGAFDEENCTQVLFRTKEEALAHIHQLLHGGEVFRHFYAKGNFKQREEELQAAD